MVFPWLAVPPLRAPGNMHVLFSSIRVGRFLRFPAIFNRPQIVVPAGAASWHAGGRTHGEREGGRGPWRVICGELTCIVYAGSRDAFLPSAPGPKPRSEQRLLPEHRIQPQTTNIYNDYMSSLPLHAKGGGCVVGIIRFR